MEVNHHQLLTKFAKTQNTIVLLVWKENVAFSHRRDEKMRLLAFIYFAIKKII